MILALAASVLAAAELHRLDRLPRLREEIEVGSVSSYDRTGGNDDGFSGAYSFVRMDERGLVLADLKGPGVVTRIWTPTPTDDPLELYFDGESEPRIRLPFRDLFTGERDPFLRPLVGSALGGNYSYVPIPYQRSLTIVVRAEKIQFYQINYETHPPGAALSSLDESRESLERARELWGRAGSDVHRYGKPPEAEVKSLAASETLAPGERATLFDLREPGRIVGLKLAPASRFAGKDGRLSYLSRRRDLVPREHRPFHRARPHRERPFDRLRGGDVPLLRPAAGGARAARFRPRGRRLRSGGLLSGMERADPFVFAPERDSLEEGGVDRGGAGPHAVPAGHW